jgi:23S rRNA pseudouridine2457 synthase
MRPNDTWRGRGIALQDREMPTEDLGLPCLILFNKPFLVLSERSGGPGQPTVADYVPWPDLDPAGRLDYDSEGLLVLTNVGWLQHAVAHPRHKLPKTYWAQVEGRPADEALARLGRSVVLGDGPARAEAVRRIAPPRLWPRDPPAQERRDLGASWIEVTLCQGRRRQLRRMTAAVGHPTLRLVRVAVGPWRLGALLPGQWREVPCPRDRIALLRMSAATPEGRCVR